MSLLLIVGLITLMNCLIVLEGILSYKYFTFLPSQISYQGCRFGLPFVGHGAMWSDFLIINPVTVGLVYFYGSFWTTGSHWGIFLITQAVNVGLHQIWIKATPHDEPGCLMQFNHLTPAGYVHVVYQGIGVFVISLFYFGTPKELIDPTVLIVTSVLMALHIPVGNQMLLSFFKPKWWSGDSLHDPVAWAIMVFVWSALVWRTCVLYRN